MKHLRDPDLKGCVQSQSEKSRKAICKVVNSGVSLQKDKLPENWFLSKIPAVPSKWKSSEGRTVYNLWDLDKQRLIDMFCTGKGGKKPWGCSHAIALLWMTGQRQGNIKVQKTTKSEEAFFDGIHIPDPFGSDSESDEEFYDK